MAFGRKKAQIVQDDQVEAEGTQPSSSVPFLGVLRSEYDTPTQVPQAFSRVGEVTTLVANAYQRGLITADIAGELLAGLQLSTTDGYAWRFGTATKRWYRRVPGGTWRVSLPPEQCDDDLSSAMHEADEVLEELVEAVSAAEDVVRGAATSAT